MNGNTETQQPGEKNSNGSKKKITIIVLIVLAAAGLGFGARWLVHRLMYTVTEDAQVDSDMIPVAPKVPGRIVNLLVAEGDMVKKGQLIAEIGSDDYSLTLDRAKAGLEAARRELEKAEAGLALTDAGTSVGLKQSEAGLSQVESGLSISATQREVNLEKLRKDYERAKVNVERVSGRVNEVRVTADQALTDLSRAESLYKSGVVSKAQLDQARTSADAMGNRLSQAEQEAADAEKQLELARSNLRAAAIDSEKESIAEQDRAKAGLGVSLSRAQREDSIKAADAGVKALRAKVRDMEATVEQAEIALSETKVLSPVDGVVARKASQLREIVSAGKPIFFVIDTSNLWVTANIEETKLKNIEIGSNAVFTVDAIPGRHWKGRVGVIGAAANSKFALIPQSNPSGQFIKVTQRIPIKIFLHGDLSGLRPGMNVIVTIRNK